MSNSFPVLLLHQVGSSIFTRPCKRSIVEAIGLAYLLTDGQYSTMVKGYTHVLAGCFSSDGEEYVWIIDPGNGVILEPSSDLDNSNVTDISLNLYFKQNPQFAAKTVMFTTLLRT